MKSWKLLSLLILSLSVKAAMASPQGASVNEPLEPLPSFVLGYNQSWFANDYGSGLTSNFKPAYVEEVFDGIKAAGGDVVRLWLFERRQGFVMSAEAPQVTGLNPQMLKNIAQVLEIARQKHLRVYLTLFDGGDMPEEDGESRSYYYNLLNNKYGEADAFRTNVLRPLLQLLNQHQEIIYALDLMNEIEAPLLRNFWSERWDGPRRWMREMRSFVKTESPWLKVTTSSGWHVSYLTIAAGMFSDIGLDFYDLHAYADEGLNSLAFIGACYRANQDKVPLLLGEFGQMSKIENDELQAKTTIGFLKAARASCFVGALAWRFDKAEKWWNYQRPDGSYRPATLKMLEFKKSLVQ